MSSVNCFIYISFIIIKSVSSLSVNNLNELYNINKESDLDVAHIHDKTLKDQFKDFEIVYLPVVVPREALGTDEDEEAVIDYSFNAFGEPIDLKLQKNDKLEGPSMKTYIHNQNGVRILPPRPSRNCLFTHKDGNNVGAFSTCNPRQLNGLLVYNNKTLEIFPLNGKLSTEEDKLPHIIRKIDQEPILTREFIDNPVLQSNEHQKLKFLSETKDKRARNKPVGAYTLELAVFFDEAAYRIFAPYMHNDDTKLQDMIMAYLNGVQALYHHPSLGTTLEIVVVRLDIMKQQPAAMPHYNGERGKLLDSFCDYQNELNPKSDENVEHWDMAVYISGLDFFAYENGRKSGVTMGLATVGGVCLGKYACVIAELGTTNVFGKPYPSAGFTSVYILAHEIGHNLGMHHDSSGNPCPKDGYIMSPSRGTNGETQWSSCSADVMSRLSWAKCLQDGGWTKPALDQKQFSDTPGQVYTAKKQCEILLVDGDAYPTPNQQLATICYNLQCKTPHRSGYYHSGPALEGTECGPGQYCYGGECVPRKPPKPLNMIPGGWGPWKLGSCSSGCTYKSMGYQEKRRICNKPIPMNTDSGCEGNSYEVGLCNDEKLCRKKTRKAATELASEKCKEFAKLLPQLDGIGSGLQAPHEENRLWMGCAIFCRRADSGSYYTPRIELNDLGVSPYFPDGTWCHSDTTGEYYCLQHHCLPEQFQFTKSFLSTLGEDIPIPQNAHPKDDIPHDLQKYLSLGEDGKPLKTVLIPGAFNSHADDGWETNDYVELPAEMLKKQMPVEIAREQDGGYDLDFM